VESAASEARARAVLTVPFEVASSSDAAHRTARIALQPCASASSPRSVGDAEVAELAATSYSTQLLDV
jgi:hypothetical protein